MKDRKNVSEGVSLAQTPRTGTLRSVNVLRRVSTELEQLSNDLHRFQHDLSELLAQTEVSPDLMRRIQSLDDATQRLHALSQVALAMTRYADGIQDLSQSEMEALVPLGALRDRLMGETSTCETSDPDHGHVSLF